MILNTHINVEYCNYIKSNMYVCKFENKGSDDAIFTLQQHIFQHDVGGGIFVAEKPFWEYLGFLFNETTL